MKRVNFKRIEIENFLSVGSETVNIDFKTGLNVITGINHDKEDSKNGVGKSTIADALFFCLFGTTIRELKKEDIINNINKKKCKVKLEFEVIENKITRQLVLTRCISPTKVLLEIDGVDSTKSSMPKTTEEICQIIGASADVFKNAVIMTVNGTIPFMAQKKVEKRKFCEGLFNLGVFQNMLLDSRKIYNDLKGSISIEDAKKEEVSKTLDIYTTQKKNKDDARESRITKLLGRQTDNTKELTKENSIIEVIEPDKIKDFEKNIKLLEVNKISNQDLVRKCIREIATREEQVKTKNNDTKELNEFGDRCDKCKRTFSDDDKKSLETKKKNILTDIKTLKTEIKEKTVKQAEYQQINDNCTKAIDKQKNNIVEVNTTIQRNENTRSRIEQLNTWNKQIKIDIKALDEDKDEFQELITETETRLQAITTALAKLNKDLSITDSIKYIVSEEGVKSFIIKKLLKILNGKLAYYLKRLDAPCQFKFNEYFGEQIINERGEECSYDNFSSGERKRIDLAILFTFMDIRRLQGNNSINIAFYDEILDTSLDDKGIELFLDIINERIEKYDEACYIISHKKTAIKTATNEVIFLEKENGFTTVGSLTEEIT